MNEVGCAKERDNKKWYQKIIRVREADRWNTKSIYLDLFLIRVSTMDTFKLNIDIDLDFEGLIIAFSIPYLKVWLGYKSFNKFSNLFYRKPNYYLVEELRK